MPDIFDSVDSSANNNYLPILASCTDLRTAYFTRAIAKTRARGHRVHVSGNCCRVTLPKFCSLLRVSRRNDATSGWLFAEESNCRASEASGVSLGPRKRRVQECVTVVAGYPRHASSGSPCMLRVSTATPPHSRHDAVFEYTRPWVSWPRRPFRSDPVVQSRATFAIKSRFLTGFYDHGS